VSFVEKVRVICELVLLSVQELGDGELGPSAQPASSPTPATVKLALRVRRISSRRETCSEATARAIPSNQWSMVFSLKRPHPDLAPSPAAGDGQCLSGGKSHRQVLVCPPLVEVYRNKRNFDRHFERHFL
jgi:hypothetical protein